MWIQLYIFTEHTLWVLIVLISSQCLQSCTEGKYGANCSYNCTCMNGATCDPVNGTCTCTQGWTGPDCSTRACSDGLFGPKCLSVCQCNVDNTDMWVLSCYICTLWEVVCTLSCNYMLYVLFNVPNRRSSVLLSVWPVWILFVHVKTCSNKVIWKCKYINPLEYPTISEMVSSHVHRRYFTISWTCLWRALLSTLWHVVTRWHDIPSFRFKESKDVTL